MRRCPIIAQPTLEAVLHSGQVFSAALDVFETEPLFMDSILLSHPRFVLGSHNASNAAHAVARTSEMAIGKFQYFLGQGKA